MTKSGERQGREGEKRRRGEGEKVYTPKPKALTPKPSVVKPKYPKESLATKKARAAGVLEVMLKLYPDAKTELEHTNPFELLVSTVLSAQATDVSVNKATPALFKQFPDAASMAQATPEEVEPLVKTIGLYRAKARNIVALSQQLVEKYGGEVPVDIAKLRELPGVGWKTATVVLGAAFDVPGIAVDTHLMRLASRLGFSKEHDPEKIGADYQKLFPKDQWVFVHHALILFGRYRCVARKPQCEGCELKTVCISKGAW